MSESLDNPERPDPNVDIGLFERQISDKLDRLLLESNDASTQSTPLDGAEVAHYRVRYLLGSGAFGVVYLADDTVENRPVALKLPRFEVLCNPENRQRFLAEAELVLGFDHPGIVKVYDCDIEGPTPYIASAWCDGGDLGKWRKQQAAAGNSRPHWQEVVSLMADVADGVQYAHEQGVVHRDLKPANILLSRKLDDGPDGDSSFSKFKAQVTDFGLAKMNDPSIVDSKSSLLVGTPLYMAPEQLQRFNGTDSNSAAADVYSLGAILFETLTGKLPIQGETYFEVLNKIHNEPPRRISQIRKHLPPELDAICRTCLQKNPAARYQSAAQLARDLRACLSGERITKKSLNCIARFRFWFSRKDWFPIAGWFAMGSQAIVTLWLILSDISKIAFGLLTPAEYLELTPVLIWVAATTSFTMIALGWLTVKRKWWATWLGAALAAVNLYSPVVALIKEPAFFNELYSSHNPYFSFKVHLILLLCFLAQLILFLCAAISSNRSKL